MCPCIYSFQPVSDSFIILFIVAHEISRRLGVFVKTSVLIVCTCVMSLAVARKLDFVFVDFVCASLWECN
jgi:hypothetical protein